MLLWNTPKVEIDLVFYPVSKSKFEEGFNVGYLLFLQLAPLSLFLGIRLLLTMEEYKSQKFSSESQIIEFKTHDPGLDSIWKNLYRILMKKCHNPNFGQVFCPYVAFRPYIDGISEPKTNKPSTSFKKA